ncbi:MAG: hypothetical protein HYU02_01100 [Thaumarchaeota archaeon]|nr:hypothetical protein [Nitrososphaerota archaeon]
MPARSIDEIGNIDSLTIQRARDAFILTDFDARISGFDLGGLAPAFPWHIEENRILSSKGKRVSAGSSGLDALLGGGLGCGYVTDFYGARSTGKSQLCFQLALNNSVAGNNTLFIDTLGSFRPERITQMAEAKNLDPEKLLQMIFVMRCLTLDQQLQVPGKVAEFLKNGGASLLIIDDISNNFLPSKVDVTNIQVRSLFARHIHEISYLAMEKTLSIAITNGVRAKPGIEGSKEVREAFSQVTSKAIAERIKLESRGRFIVAIRADGRMNSFTITESGISD